MSCLCELEDARMAFSPFNKLVFKRILTLNGRQMDEHTCHEREMLIGLRGALNNALPMIDALMKCMGDIAMALEHEHTKKR